MNVILIQARMTSSRLPGKCMKNIAGYSLTEWVLYAAKQCGIADLVGLVVPQENESRIFFDKYSDFYIHAGPRDDVLSRYYQACCHLSNVDNVVRLTSDCPLLAYYPRYIGDALRVHASKNFDYTSNRGNCPSGLDVEVVSMNTLKFLNDNVSSEQEREHVTLHIKNNMHKFKTMTLEYGKTFNCKWSVDTQEDFERVEDVLNFHAQMNCMDIMRDWRNK